MKKRTSIGFALLFTAWLAQAQESTLKVTGDAYIAVKPTQTTVNFTIESKSETYSGAIEDMISRVDLVSKELKKIKFEDREIVTSTFRVEKSQVYVKNMWKDSGFVATQNLMITFPYEKKRLLEVLNTATKSEARSEISLSFSLDNERKNSVMQELMKLAVKDARSKGELLASEAGYQIIGIREISYGVGASAPQPLYAMAESAAFKSMDVQLSTFEASDLTFSDHVTIVFAIGSMK